MQGRLPDLPFTWRCETESEGDESYPAGQSILRVVRMDVTVGGKPFCWKFFLSLPKRKTPVPAFLMLMFGMWRAHRVGFDREETAAEAAAAAAPAKA